MTHGAPPSVIPESPPPIPPHTPRGNFCCLRATAIAQSIHLQNVTESLSTSHPPSDRAVYAFQSAYVAQHFFSPMCGNERPTHSPAGCYREPLHLTPSIRARGVRKVLHPPPFLANEDSSRRHHLSTAETSPLHRQAEDLGKEIPCHSGQASNLVHACAVTSVKN